LIFFLLLEGGRRYRPQVARRFGLGAGKHSRARAMDEERAPAEKRVCRRGPTMPPLLDDLWMHHILPLVGGHALRRLYLTSRAARALVTAYLEHTLSQQLLQHPVAPQGVLSVFFLQANKARWRNSGMSDAMHMLLLETMRDDLGAELAMRTRVAAARGLRFDPKPAQGGVDTHLFDYYRSNVEPHVPDAVGSFLAVLYSGVDLVGSFSDSLPDEAAATRHYGVFNDDRIEAGRAATLLTERRSGSGGLIRVSITYDLKVRSRDLYLDPLYRATLSDTCARHASCTVPAADSAKIRITLQQPGLHSEDIYACSVAAHTLSLRTEHIEEAVHPYWDKLSLDYDTGLAKLVLREKSRSRLAVFQVAMAVDDVVGSPEQPPDAHGSINAFTPQGLSYPVVYVATAGGGTCMACGSVGRDVVTLYDMCVPLRELASFRLPPGAGRVDSLDRLLEIAARQWPAVCFARLADRHGPAREPPLLARASRPQFLYKLRERYIAVFERVGLFEVFEGEATLPQLAF